MGDIVVQGVSVAAWRRLFALSLVSLVVACGSSTPPGGAGPTTSRAPSEHAESFPVAAFAQISADPVTARRSGELQAALDEMSELAGGAGMSATVLSPAGTWSGAVGRADPGRAVGVGDQFAIGSVTKSLVAAQVMLLVERGRLRLDDPAARYLPAGLDFDSNGATVRQLLGMRSGIPNYWPELEATLATDRRRVWTTPDMLALVPAERTPAGTTFDYSDTNYLLLQHVIEQVTGRRVVQVMRDGGVLDIDGIERLVYQPDERPTAPMALPDAMSPTEWAKGGGYLPSIASATAGPTTGAIATNSLSLAHWWQAFCAGEIVSRESLTTMSTFVDDYGLGLFDVADLYAASFGHAGQDIGYVSWAGCLPDSGSVVVVLSNHVVDDIGGMPRPLVVSAESDETAPTTP